VRPLPDRAFNQLQVDLLTRLDRLGRTEAVDRGSAGNRRRISIEVTIPGQVGDPRLPDLARLQYEEWWRRSSFGWVRVRYNYNHLDLAHGGRFGYHLHPLAGNLRLAVPHQVCVRPDGTGEGLHFAAHEIDLLDAHDRFEGHYAFDRRIACLGLTRIG
jgi:hypothetical protein